MEPVFVKTKRGGKKLIFGQFLYKLNRSRGDVHYYRCDNAKCKGPTIIMEGEFITKMTKVESEYHNHEERTSDIAKLKAVEIIKERAANDRLSQVTDIYREETNRLAQDALPLPPPDRPLFNEIKTQLYNARNAYLPAIPQGVDDIRLEGSWAETLRGEKFLQADIGTGADKILIFSTKGNLQKLQACKTVYMDGTFSALPLQFSQLYTIHGNYMGQVFPMVYGLLQNKKKTTYMRFLEEIKLQSAFQPEKFITDFEISVFDAITTVFPQAEKKGCLFHYSQCIWRKVQELGMVTSYRDCTETKKWIQRLIALPLIPQQLIGEAFLLTQEDAPDNPQALVMHDYVVDTWVDDAALFHSDIWNHFQTKGDRTNNKVEGFHSKLNGILRGRKHQNIFEYVSLLQRLQQEAEMDAADLERGAIPKKKELTYRNIDLRLESLKERLTNETINLPQYLDAVRHVLSQK